MKKFFLTNEDTARLCREVGLLLHAGVEPGSGLLLLAKDTAPGGLRQTLESMAFAADEGRALSEAMEATGAFPAYACALVAVGERTGRSEEALNALADFYERQDALEKHLRSALLYPAVLMLLMLAVIVVLLTKVLPVFNDVYARLGGSLTGLAGGLLKLGGFLDSAMPVLCVVLALALIFMAAFAASGALRSRLSGFWLRHWGHRGLCRKMSSARFAQAFAMGLRSGMTAEEAVELAAGLLEGQSFGENCRKCASALASGGALGKTLEQFQLIPAADCRLLELGQRSGCGDRVMEQIARRLAQDSEDALERSIGRVEPAMVLSTAALVGAILLAVMIPLLNIMSAIG